MGRIVNAEPEDKTYLFCQWPTIQHNASWHLTMFSL